jgi:ribosomal-protein-alanine N-acetyltransferase
VNIRNAKLEDIAQVIELERSSPTAAHWNEQQYRQALELGNGGPARHFLVARASRSEESHLLGFLVARHLGPEWELENIVVGPDMRRRGIGACLLDALLSCAREANATAVLLEVRDSNFGARRLYEKAGFQKSGCRKAYYSDPPEDAILYTFRVE